ncbi:hypothetical protein BRARA_F02785 [Brassica rapa]|uniref:Protein kinase domain-containing protein n=1 Tax=Brassica campestris TaxID=3711 RepID=A0A397Z5V9_BRACM|nr:hypothetical protein BRARA_F02785 [Brassica rapa]
MIFYVLFVFSVFVSATCRGEGATAAYKPNDVLLINCGATSYTNDTGNRTWTGTRIFRSNFTYKFHVSPGWKFLRLYFNPTRYGSNFDANGSFFSVRVNGFTLLKKFSAYLTVRTSKPESKYLIKEFFVPVFETLTLSFTPSPNSLAFVNGVEIVSMPDGFYTKGGYDDEITNVSSTVNTIDEATALETLYRLNVGGHMVSHVNDTGMFRRWLPDDDFLISDNSATKQLLPDEKIYYTNSTPAFVAPEDVYRTYRTVGNNQNPQLNLTWLFKVDAEFTYLVRLHFCESPPEVNGHGGRIFSIFIGNQIAKLDMDIISHTDVSPSPIYLDFSIYVGSENGLRPDLRLDLHPSNEVTPEFYGAILNGLEILKLNYPDSITEPNSIVVTSKGASNVANTTRRKRIVTITLIAVGSVLLAVSVIVFLIFLARLIKRRKKKSRQNNSVAMFKVLLKHYTYAEVRKITKSFSNTIGKGGFGTVYGGNLCNGPKVAVKVLKDSMGNGEDFINEVASMSQTSHVNIVSLLGFCYEGSKRAIVYEFLENGSLDQFISREKPLTLDVKTLYGISLGVARGLEYLHYGCKTRIVHFDIKPQNILLDGNLCPKVSDFGLAKLCETRESIVSLMDTRGTIGYIAPEVFSRMYGGVSHKSDVYSYGMLVLEMFGARSKKIVETTTDSNASSAYFPDWIYEDLENGQQTWILGDEITTEENEIARKMILVSLWCIQPCPMDRPPMNRVVEMIEGSLDALEIPPKPSMHISRGFVPDQSSSLPSFSHGYEAEEKNSNL